MQHLFQRKHITYLNLHPCNKNFRCPLLRIVVNRLSASPTESRIYSLTDFFSHSDSAFDPLKR